MLGLRYLIQFVILSMTVNHTATAGGNELHPILPIPDKEDSKNTILILRSVTEPFKLSSKVKISKTEALEILELP